MKLRFSIEHRVGLRDVVGVGVVVVVIGVDIVVLPIDNNGHSFIYGAKHNQNGNHFQVTFFLAHSLSLVIVQYPFTLLLGGSSRIDGHAP